MKAVVILLSILLFIACLVLGIQAGNMSIDSLPGGLGGNAPQPAANTQQRTLLLLGVDDLSKSTPVLTSVWVAFYRPDIARITLFPFFPSISSAGNKPLADSFALLGDGSVNPAFFEALKEYHFDWNGYVLIDQPGVARFVDGIGGVQIQGVSQNGAGVMDLLQRSGGDPAAALEIQQQLGNSLCARLDQVSPEPDWYSLWNEMISGHMRSSIAYDTLKLDWDSLSKLTDPLTCEFPQP